MKFSILRQSINNLSKISKLVEFRLYKEDLEPLLKNLYLFIGML